MRPNGSAIRSAPLAWGGLCGSSVVVRPARPAGPRRRRASGPARRRARAIRPGDPSRRCHRGKDVRPPRPSAPSASPARPGGVVAPPPRGVRSARRPAPRPPAEEGRPGPAAWPSRSGGGRRRAPPSNPCDRSMWRPVPPRPARVGCAEGSWAGDRGGGVRRMPAGPRMRSRRHDVGSSPSKPIRVRGIGASGRMSAPPCRADPRALGTGGPHPIRPA